MGMGRWEGERAIGRWRQGKKESGERERKKKKRSQSSYQWMAYLGYETDGYGYTVDRQPLVVRADGDWGLTIDRD